MVRGRQAQLVLQAVHGHGIHICASAHTESGALSPFAQRWSGRWAPPSGNDVGPRGEGNGATARASDVLLGLLAHQLEQVLAERSVSASTAVEVPAVLGRDERQVAQRMVRRRLAAAVLVVVTVGAYPAIRTCIVVGGSAALMSIVNVRFVALDPGGRVCPSSVARDLSLVPMV